MLTAAAGIILAVRNLGKTVAEDANIGDTDGHTPPFASDRTVPPLGESWNAVVALTALTSARTVTTCILQSVDENDLFMCRMVMLRSILTFSLPLAPHLTTHLTPHAASHSLVLSRRISHAASLTPYLTPHNKCQLRGKPEKLGQEVMRKEALLVCFIFAFESIVDVSPSSLSVVARRNVGVKRLVLRGGQEDASGLSVEGPILSEPDATSKNETDDQQHRLISASKDGDTDRIESAIKAGADLNLVDPDGMTCLLHAAACGQLAACQCLLRLGSKALHQAPDGSSAVHLAAYYGHESILRFFFKGPGTEYGFDIDMKDKDGSTPLHNAAYRGQCACASFLLLNGAMADACQVSCRSSACSTRMAGAFRVFSGIILC